ncbi:MAG: hypothetical protein GY903_02975 [Fuerstiella sp.]|nr:hypothetical protein [Fuerstiella sp.]MCP4853437.1 hypothetical protein [Fuerstiella sp.]
MSATLEVPTNTDTPEPEDNLPDASVLEDKTPEWCRVSGAVAAFLLPLGLVLMIFANRPLWHSDLWDHINYGEHILQHQVVAKTEPLLPLAQGVPTVNSAWLSQVGMALMYRTDGLGLPALQFAYGMLIVISLGAIGYAVTKRSGSAAFGILSSAIFLAVNWQQFLIVRPQSVGVAFFSIVLAVLATGGIRRRLSWVALPLIFAVWANCHGSFAMGLLLMGLVVVGRVVDVAMQTRSLSRAFRNRPAMRLLLLTQLCAVAALLNPNGLAIYHEVLRVGSHPNIATMYEWDPLTLRMQQGQMAACAAVLLLFVLRCSPRRLRAIEMLPLLVTGGMALWSGRMLNWFAPVCAVVTCVHAAAAWRAFRNTERRTIPYPRTGLWTVVSLGLCWVFFGFSSLGMQTIHGKTPDLRRTLSRGTPVQPLEYLNSMEEIPPGIAFMPAEWTGYLTRFGPPDLKPMVSLHVHVIPEEVWSDYVRLIEGPTDWAGLLERYGINFIIADKIRNARLIKSLRESGEYRTQYEDVQAAMFVRIKPIR